MRRGLLSGLGWLATTLLATVVAWQGVQLVASEVTERRVPPLSNREVAAALSAGEKAHAPPRARPSSTTSTAAATTRAIPSRDPGQGSTSSSLAPTTPSSAPPPAGAPSATTTTQPPPPDSSTRIIDSTGGQVAVRYEAGESVWLWWARPNPGYGVVVKNTGPDRVEVLFESHNHRSLVQAFWDNGSPVERVDEEDT